MSVLYKALQKAEKENELRQSEAGFDPQQLARSGALKYAGNRGVTLNRTIMSAIIILAVGGGAAFLLFKDSLLPAPAAPNLPMVEQVAPAQPIVRPPSATAPAASGSVPVAGNEALTTESPSAVTGQAPTAVPASEAPAPTAVAQAAAEEPAAEVPAGLEAAAAPPPPAARAVARPAASPLAKRTAALPEIPANSPARMLSPPITINRAEFALTGAGDQVQVREVSQAARGNVAAGYDALVRGRYDEALGFYDAALKDEPNSILALLGRGTALQKLNRGQDAQVPYGQVLKLDPQNREALTNLTAVVAERAPQEALARLLELEREYPGFSPVKAQIGLTYAKAGSMRQALDYLSRAVALAPEAVMYHYNLALVLDHMGRREQAILGYERVLASISGGRGPADLSPTDIERRVRFLRAR